MSDAVASDRGAERAGLASDPVLAAYDAALEHWASRLLSQVQSNPAFPYFGCIDRDYWHYRAAAGFPSAMFQIGTLALALGAVEAGRTSERERFLQLAIASLHFWAKMQHSDGSFDEWYVRERSYAATAFSTFAAAEALLVLRDAGLVTGSFDTAVISAITKAAAWLAPRSDPHASNHTAGGIAAMHCAALLSDRASLKDAAFAKLRAFAASQTDEGWIPEYGGFDPGYLSVSIGYLAAYLQRGGSPLAREVIARALPAAAAGVNPDGSYGGEHGSRNTLFLLPHGFEMIAGEFELAEWILRQTLGRGHRQLVGPHNADDRYFAFFFLWSFLWARRARRTRSVAPGVPADPTIPGRFERAGIVRASVGPWQLTLNLSKGGAFRLYQFGRLRLVESGYAVRLGSTRWATTQTLARPLTADVIESEQRVEVAVTARLHQERPTNPLDRLGLPFAIYQETFARVGPLARAAGDAIKARLIRHANTTPLTLARRITLTPQSVNVADSISNSGRARLLLVAATGDATTMHNPSSRFVPDPVWIASYARPTWLGRMPGGASLRRRIELTPDATHVTDSGLELVG